jgi:hypothetical protein
MKKTVLLLALFAGGVAASFAIASPSGSLIAQTLTGQTGTNGKVTICHRTHSAKNPWVKITIGAAALPAHARHGDQDLVNGACPTSGPSGPTGANGPAGSTSGTTTGTTTSHGKSGEDHGKNNAPSHGKNNAPSHGKSGEDHGKNNAPSHGKSGLQHGKSGLQHGKNSLQHGKSSSHKKNG